MLSSNFYLPRKPAPMITVLFLAGRAENEDGRGDDICIKQD